MVLVEPGGEDPYRREGERSLRAVEGRDTPYRRLHDNAVLVKDLLLSPPVAGEVEAVAEAVLGAANDADPDPRRVVLANGKAIVLGELLPDRLRDRLFGLTFWSPLGPVRERLRDVFPSPRVSHRGHSTPSQFASRSSP